LSFFLGVGLFGSVYLMPVFLAYVRHHDAFEIGTIMLVTGVAQLATAPIAGLLESRFDPRWLSAAGFGLFAIGLGCSAFESRVADFQEMFWPQVLRGVAIMFCLLPPTRLALGSLTASRVPDASGLFNLMRNLGGRNRHRADRYDPLRTHRRACRRFARAPDCGRCDCGSGDRA
jgi:DHA2 family multidrug resistance protein